MEAAAAQGWTAAAHPMIGQLPTPGGYESIGWILVAVCAIVTGLGAVAGLVIAIWTIVEKIRGRRVLELSPSPMLTQEVQGPPQRHELTTLQSSLAELKHERAEDVREINGKLDNLTKAVGEINGVQYRKRKPLHKQLNIHANALSFIAGRMDLSGDKAGASHINALITASQGDENNE